MPKQFSIKAFFDHMYFLVIDMNHFFVSQAKAIQSFSIMC